MADLWQEYDRSMTGIWHSHEGRQTTSFQVIESSIAWGRHSAWWNEHPPRHAGLQWGWWCRAALRILGLPPSSRTRGCLHCRLDLGEGCPVACSRLRVWYNADHEILQEGNLEKLPTRSRSHAWHIYTRYIPSIYLVYTWHMTIYVVTLEYTSKKLYGFVLYQSRTLIDMWYPKDILGIKLLYN